MRFPHHSRMSVTRRGEKELRLGAFIARGLDGIAAPAHHAEPPPAQHAVLVIARSVQSPVVKSVGSLAREIATAGCAVRIILARSERSGPVDIPIAMQTATLCQVRLARNPRLIEAHEQLVIGARICWTGDTMRRDPATCDAYESFVEDCPEIAAAAASTFERLWGDAEPLSGPLPAAAALGTPKAIVSPAFLGRRP
jgi:hypothetical protein